VPKTIELSTIGHVKGGRSDLHDDAWGSVESTINLDRRQFDDGALEGLEAFSHLEIVFILDRVEPETVERGSRHPRGRTDWPSVGILAQRAKRRPNRLAVSRCRLLEIDGWRLHVADLDAVDETPILDVKPYMREFGPRGPVEQPEWSHALMTNYYEDSTDEED
jgi:tRNA (Thr-GGU) A37 N-methylase